MAKRNLPAVTPAVIRSTRNRLGLTQRAFGELLNCSESRICHLEQGTTRASGPMLRLLQCAARGASPQELAGMAKKLSQNGDE